MNPKKNTVAVTSLSARRAWIEIVLSIILRKAFSVALRKESVDRNTSKDKNTMQVPVALRKESVDRNVFIFAGKAPYMESLSARRAWIEITSDYPASCRIRSRSPQGERG